MKKRTAGILLIIGALLSIGAVLSFYAIYAIYDTQVIKLDLEVWKNPGFNVDDEKISFGKMIPQSASSREMIITNGYDKPLLVTFKIDGNISRFISTPDAFTLNSTQSKKVNVHATIPSGEAYAQYGGKLKVIFRRI
jgi:hypothetical protein